MTSVNPGNCILRIQPEKTGIPGERGRDGKQPLSRSIECSNKVVAISFELLAEYEHALLAGKTDFLYLPVFAQQHCVVI